MKSKIKLHESRPATIASEHKDRRPHVFARSRIQNSLYAPKQQEYDEYENDEPKAAARVISPTLAVRPGRESTQRNQEQNHNEYGYHVCSRPLSRGVQRSGLGLSTSARALDIRRSDRTIHVFV